MLARAAPSPGRPSTARIAVFFGLFSLAPGLLYQYVQDHARESAANAHGILRLALGVAPNALGALAAASAIFVMGLGIAKAASTLRIAIASALIAIAGLAGWEVAQFAIPGATFDVEDLKWTLFGGAGFLIAASLFFPLSSRAVDPITDNPKY